MTSSLPQPESLDPDKEAALESRGEHAITMLVQAYAPFGDGATLLSVNDSLHIDRGYAERWLKRKYEGRLERSENVSKSDRRLGRITAFASIIAAIFSVIGGVVAILAWLDPQPPLRPTLKADTLYHDGKPVSEVKSVVVGQFGSFTFEVNDHKSFFSGEKIDYGQSTCIVTNFYRGTSPATGNMQEVVDCHLVAS